MGNSATTFARITLVTTLSIMRLIAFALIVSFHANQSFANPKSRLSASSWGLNDVSILMPLPLEVRDDHLLRADVRGAKGTLLPADLFRRVGVLAAVNSREPGSYQSLRVIAIRVDPCFPGADPLGHSCRRQIRLVWQPLEVDREGRITTVDAAVHTFYDLTENEFQFLLGDLARLKQGSMDVGHGLPLQVHPVLATQGLVGPFGKGLRETVLRHAGEVNLTRLTFMRLHGPNIIWVFGGFDIDRGMIEKIPIARVPNFPVATAQTFINRTLTGDDFRMSGLAPFPEGSDTFNLLMRESSKIDPVRDRQEIIENVMSIHRVENPDFHSPESVDCVSCHVAQPARHFALKNFGAFGLEKLAETHAYRSALNLQNTSPVQANTRSIRAFGYFFRDPAISQRAINETAAAVQRLNEKLNETP
jgi:hypothetical protein